MLETNIDAVISWVDGYDPVYQQKLQSFCSKKGIIQKNVLEPTRIQQCNEIHYCLLALYRFAPWLQNIYIITNQQVPPIVYDLQHTAFGSKIRIIDQNELLAALDINEPIFNSLSVEWLIWQIKGLSKHFIYLNDDFFIIRNVEPQDFFRNNCVVLRGEWKVQAEKSNLYRIKKQLLQPFGWKVVPKTNPHRAWQENAARIAGLSKRFYLLPHAPFPLSKTTFDEFSARQPELVTANARYPFRHPTQISSIPLITHQEIQKKRVLYDNHNQAIMVNGACHSLRKIKSRLAYAKNNQRVFCVCMQSLDATPTELRHYMLDWLQQSIG